MADAAELLRELIEAPDRDHCPGQRPVVAYREDDQADYLEAIAARARTRVRLVRRGRWHGEWVELAEHQAPPAPMPYEAVLQQRWHTARPILLRQYVQPLDFADEIADRGRLLAELGEAGRLRAFLKACAGELEPHFELTGRPAELVDIERDIERHTLVWHGRPGDSSGPRARNLWVKSAWLSTGDEDASLRMRLSFGQEGPDDASSDLRKHRRVSEMAEALLPECGLVHDHQELAARLESFVGGPVFYTQHIAYWNAPGGGALFHHDAFEESLGGGQRGVCYVQLSGRTAWLALSVEDLTRRVIELSEYLQEGELPWVRQALFGRRDIFERFTRLTRRFPRVRRELTRPDCGSLAGLVNRGPEFTSLLADAGHALLLEPGDVLLLPNQGLANTCMHSVFHAGDGPAYGLSMAIRERYPAPPDEFPPTDPAPDPAPDPRGPGRGWRAGRRNGRRRRGPR